MIDICTPAELEAFTRKTERAQKRYDSQVEVLKHLGIPYTKRPDKTLIVYRRHVDNGQTEEQSERASPAVCL